MNYLAHAAADLERPYFVAGLGIPDWLSVIDRRVRARSTAAARLADDPDRRVRELVAGIVQHHHDDRWFHQTRVFAEMNLQFAVEIREYLPGDEGFRPSFLGHIAIELLLDADLILENPSLADRYYQTLEQVSPALVEGVINRISAKPTRALQRFIPRFIAERFLYDYLDDGSLLFRLNQVMRRVGLPRLPKTLLPWLGVARARVAEARGSLLSPPESSTEN